MHVTYTHRTDEMKAVPTITTHFTPFKCCGTDHCVERSNAHAFAPANLPATFSAQVWSIGRGEDAAAPIDAGVFELFILPHSGTLRDVTYGGC